MVASARPDLSAPTNGDIRARRQLRQDMLDQQRALTKRLAQPEQQDAATRDELLQSIMQMVDCAAGICRSLVGQLVLQAERGQFLAQLRAKNVELLTAEEREELAASSQEADGAVLEGEARAFVTDCGRRLEFCLERMEEALLNEDLILARQLHEQASRITKAMREIQDGWPWSDARSTLESWAQYQRGELMDFETFRHELLKVAK
jgi:hypothetical protein